jgi:alkyl hydroperoxide reductase subunit AhpF
VPHLGRADAVGEDQDGAHGADPIVLPMPLFSHDDDARVRELLAKMERAVELVLAQGPEETPLPGAGDVDFGAETERIVRELCELSDLLTMRVEEQPDGYERFPAIGVLPEGRDVGVRYYGLPWGYELGSLIGAVLEAGYAESTLSPESLERLAAHEGELAIDVFVTPT